MPKLTITVDTILKSGVVDASTLPAAEKHFANEGETFDIDAYVLEAGHIKFTLAKDGSFPTIAGRNTWYVFAKHATTGERDGIQPSQFRVNSIALKVIPAFEGLELKQYYCPAGISTIGYGATVFIDGGDVPVGAIITEEIATELLQRDLTRFVASLRSLVKVPLTGRQIGALTSFVYNLGAGALAESTLLRRLNGGESREAIAAEFLKWDKADGVQLPGLTRRREAERDLWLGFQPKL
jgi:GH24 family phage-related lysozyme (muramidase)